VLGGGGVTVAGLISRRLVLRGLRAASLASLLAGVAVLLVTIEVGRGHLAKQFRGLTSATLSQVAPETTVVSVGSYLPAVDFYLDRQIEIVKHDDRERLREVWQGPEPVAAFVAARDVEAARSLLPGATVIAQDRHTTVMYNRAVTRADKNEDSVH